MRVIDTIEELATEAAAGDDIKKYLHLRGLRTVASLALVAPDEETLARHIIDPLFSGWTQEGITINVHRNEQPIAKAIILHMWNLARASWSRHLAAQMMPSSSPPTATPSTTTPATSTTDHKAPKSLPPGVWSGLLRAYNSIQLAGEDREFPVLQVLGAEVTIARMHHEHTVTSLYSQVHLGELIQRRSFTAGGDINPLAKTKKGTTLELGEDNTLVATDDVSWSPRSLLAIMDGLDSIRWAMVLVKWGEEKPIHELFDWLHQRARSRPNKTEQFAHYWQSVSWTIAMMLRSGHTFKEITSNITKDLDKFNDYMARESTPTKVKQAPNEVKGIGKAGKSKSQKGEKGNPYRSQPYHRERWGPQHETQQWNGNRTWNRPSYNNQYQKWQPHGYDSWSSERSQK